MSIDTPVAALTQKSAPAVIGVRSANYERLDTVLTVVFATTAVLFVSFIAVVTGLI
ncbi:MAG TPA: hypothetical protein VMJ52_18245 [Xanthobacteraceae bacterium]|nr:hypothetical protein [Xanthobacteraceae bacterium]